MSFTRFHDDDLRIEKQLEQQTYIGRYQLDVPGQGASMPFQDDAQLRMQGWGANLQTNTINLERRNGVIPSIPEEQRTPSSAQIAATASAPNDRYGLQTDFLGGYIISDVPCMAIINTSQTDNITPTEQFPGSSGNLVQGVRSAADETLVFGISPDELKCTIRLGTDDLYYKQTISSGGTETWLLA